MTEQILRIKPSDIVCIRIRCKDCDTIVEMKLAKLTGIRGSSCPQCNTDFDIDSRALSMLRTAFAGMAECSDAEFEFEIKPTENQA